MILNEALKYYESLSEKPYNLIDKEKNKVNATTKKLLKQLHDTLIVESRMSKNKNQQKTNQIIINDLDEEQIWAQLSNNIDPILKQSEQVLKQLEKKQDKKELEQQQDEMNNISESNDSEVNNALKNFDDIEQIEEEGINLEEESTDQSQKQEKNNIKQETTKSSKKQNSKQKRINNKGDDDDAIDIDEMNRFLDDLEQNENQLNMDLNKSDQGEEEEEDNDLINNKGSEEIEDEEEDNDKIEDDDEDAELENEFQTTKKHNEEEDEIRFQDFFGTGAKNQKSKQKQHQKAARLDDEEHEFNEDDDEDEEDMMDNDEDQIADDDIENEVFDEAREIEMEEQEGEQQQQEEEIDEENKKNENDEQLQNKKKNRVESEIERLENKLIKEKDWQRKGEIQGKQRPMNSLLNEHLDFQMGVRLDQKITKEYTEDLEKLIKQRCLDEAWDDMQQQQLPFEFQENFNNLQDLNFEKNEQGLGELYEDEFKKNILNLPSNTKEDQLKQEIELLFKKVSYNLDLLSNLNFTPKPLMQPASIKVQNVPTIQREEKIPIFINENQQKAPQELFNPKEAKYQDRNELNPQEKKKIRQTKKKNMRTHLKEKEKKLRIKKLISKGETKYVYNQIQKSKIRAKQEVAKKKEQSIAFTKSNQFFKNIHNSMTGQNQNKEVVAEPKKKNYKL